MYVNVPNVLFGFIMYVTRIPTTEKKESMYAFLALFSLTTHDDARPTVDDDDMYAMRTLLMLCP